jgi:lipid-A-disaccharide synthase
VSTPPRILISAGEASGDRLGAGLARALLARRPELQLFGMGGEKMAAAGVELVQDAEKVSVVGIFDVLAHLPAIRRAMRELEGRLRDPAPDLVVPVDFPDFNLRLSARATRAGLPVVYLVSPQIWAWRPGRVRTIRERVRRMLVLFPFETRIYEEAGVPATFVGHPLAEPGDPAPARDAMAGELGLDPGHPVLALMPGSRRIETARLLPVMLAAAARLERERGELQFLLPLAPALDERWARESVAASGLRRVVVHRGDFPRVLAACDAGVVAAGTASLEAAVAGLPLVVVYRMGWFSYWIGKSLVNVKDVALPNLVAGRRVVPELIQSECTPARIAAELGRYLDEPGRVASVRRDLDDVRRALGGPGVYERAADAVLAELDSARSSSR